MGDSKTALSTEMSDLKELLVTALVDGADVITEFESGFAENVLEKIERKGDELTISGPMQVTIDSITKRLEKEDLV